MFRNSGALKESAYAARLGIVTSTTNLPPTARFSQHRWNIVI